MAPIAHGKKTEISFH